eukprot:2816889-Amphidinium_carterae.1
MIDREIKCRVSMARMLVNRKIQNSEKHEDDNTCVLEPLGLAHMPPRGHDTESRTVYLFDMVAELAIELARRCVTRASQLFTTIIWR